MPCVAQIRTATLIAQCLPGLLAPLGVPERKQSSNKSAIDCGYDLFRFELIEARAAAANMSFAAFESTGQARQRILHDPHIAVILD
jgi:hypothetical protein